MLKPRDVESIGVEKKNQPTKIGQVDQVDQVVPAHQVDDIDEAHQVDPVLI